MEATDRDGETGLIDVTGLSLSDLSELDDSVVANALRRVLENRCDGAEDQARFGNFQSSL
jgi:FXSXX-COOH protein